MSVSGENQWTVLLSKHQALEVEPNEQNQNSDQRERDRNTRLCENATSAKGKRQNTKKDRQKENSAFLEKGLLSSTCQHRVQPTLGSWLLCFLGFSVFFCGVLFLLACGLCTKECVEVFLLELCFGC